MEQYTYLAHHGIKGQKWGVRRFQNKDGSLTDQGKRRYLSDDTKRKIKTAAKVAAGVAGAAAVGYGAYKLGKATGRVRQAAAYAHAGRIASDLGDSNKENARTMANLAKEARDWRRKARYYGETVNVSQLRDNIDFYDRETQHYSRLAHDYIHKSNALHFRASELKRYGTLSDRLAYDFVERVMKDPRVDYSVVKKLLDD